MAPWAFSQCSSESSDQFFFFFLALSHVGSLFPNQGSNPFPLHWKCRLLTTGPPGKVMIYDDLHRSVMVFIHHCSLIFWNLWLEFHSLMWMLLIIRMKANDWNNWFHWIIESLINQPIPNDWERNSPRPGIAEEFWNCLMFSQASLVAQVVKRLPAWLNDVQSLVTGGLELRGNQISLATSCISNI